MTRVIPILLAGLTIFALAGLPLAMAGGGSTGLVDEADAANETVAPGEQLSGIVGVTAAETDADVSDRAYGLAVANAATQEEAAAIVADRHADIEQRLADLEDRADRANADRDAGDRSEGAYAAEMAAVAAETAAAERQAEAAGETAAGLDEDALEAAGVDTDAIQDLQERASELSGPEVAEIARSIAGDTVGVPVSEDLDVGPPSDLPRGEAFADERGPPADDGDDDAAADEEENADETDADGASTTDDHSGD